MCSFIRCCAGCSCEVVSAAVRADRVAQEALIAAIMASKRSGRHNSAEAREALNAHLNASSNACAAREALEKAVKDYMS